MAKKQSTAVRYTAVRKVKHDGERYVAGDVLEISPEQAQPLLDIGAIQVPDSPVKEPTE